MLPSIISGFESIANTSDPMKFLYEAISYKPFISFFNVTTAAAIQPLLGGIGMYPLRCLFYLPSCELTYSL